MEFKAPGGRVNNLSTLPDDSAIASPAGSVAMDMTNIVPDRLSPLPNLGGFATKTLSLEPLFQNPKP